MEKIRRFLAVLFLAVVVLAILFLGFILPDIARLNVDRARVDKPKEIIGGPIAISDLEMICDWEGGFDDLIPIAIIPLPNPKNIETSITLAVMSYTGMKYLYMKEYGETLVKKQCSAESWTSLKGGVETRALDEGSLTRFKEAVQKMSKFLEKAGQPTDFNSVNVKREA